MLQPCQGTQGANSRGWNPDSVPEVTATDFSGNSVHSPQGAEPWLIDTCRCLQILGWLGTTGCHCCPTQVLPMGLFLGSQQVAPAKKMPLLKQEWKQHKKETNAAYFSKTAFKRKGRIARNREWILLSIHCFPKSDMSLFVRGSQQHESSCPVEGDLCQAGTRWTRHRLHPCQLRVAA